jgi:hypothetical protein
MTKIKEIWSKERKVLSHHFEDEFEEILALSPK